MSPTNRIDTYEQLLDLMIDVALGRSSPSGLESKLQENPALDDKTRALILNFTKKINKQIKAGDITLRSSDSL